MADAPPILTLAHSPDPDDAFMWWPITGKVRPDGSCIAVPAARGGERAMPGADGHRPDAPDGQATAIDTGRFLFKAVPADIEALNRLAAGTADYDITALSFRAYCDVKDRYAITHCGSSFGDGFGPKVVAPHALAERARTRGLREVLADPAVRIAIPGRRTTAFLLLAILIGPERFHQKPERFIEMPFDQVIGAASRGEADAGLVIHEGQLLYEAAGLALVVDLGAWWKESTGLPVPLGCNAVKRDLDTRFGAGSTREVVTLLHESIVYALAHRQESLEYTMPFALANAAKKGAERSGAPTLERIDRYVTMYVNDLTVDMGERGREAVRRLLTLGCELGLCPDPGALDIQ